MPRLSTAAATLHVCDTGDQLLTWWDTATPDTFQALRASFAATFPRPGEALRQREAGAWAVPYRYQKRLNKWIARWFEVGAVRWEQDARRRPAGEGGRPRARTVRPHVLSAILGAALTGRPVCGHPA